jgi:poly-gamma-glutamate capsule biosynthesis protein CapA/YwtB (metallophosphatase superfamily)
MGKRVTLFLSGDIMTGRGIDQILPHPGAPRLFEPSVRSALQYVELAEAAAGPISRPVAFDYVWGEALAELERRQPSARIVNLETAVTACGEAWPHKGIHYRMHPRNVPCLSAAGIDCCTLANNHVLDWGRAGLEETLAVLSEAHIRTAGAGRNLAQAQAPAVLRQPDGQRILVFAFGMPSSGVPYAWRATRTRPGVNWIEDLSEQSVQAVAAQVSRHGSPGSIVIASLHWGGNWGYGIPDDEREFAHRLIETAGVHLLHGHSSHHAKAIEVHQGRLILYGCGDLLNDYEGIRGYESFRGDLSLMYFPTLDATSGALVRLSMVAMQTRRLRIQRAAPEDAAWLASNLDRECSKLGTRIVRNSDDTLELNWGAPRAAATGRER